MLAASDTGPVGTILIGLLLIVIGVSFMAFRSALWGWMDRPFLEKRAAQNRTPGFSYFVSRWVAPALFIVIGFVVLVEGIAATA